MENPIVNYLVQAIGRIETANEMLLERIRVLEVEYKRSQEENRRVNEERRAFQKAVFGVLVDIVKGQDSVKGEGGKSSLGEKVGGDGRKEKGVSVEEGRGTLGGSKPVRVGCGVQCTPFSEASYGSGRGRCNPLIWSSFIPETATDVGRYGLREKMSGGLKDEDSPGLQTVFGWEKNVGEVSRIPEGRSKVKRSEDVYIRSGSAAMEDCQLLKLGECRDVGAAGGIKIEKSFASFGKAKMSTAVGRKEVNAERFSDAVHNIGPLKVRYSLSGLELAVIDYVFDESIDNLEYIVRTEYTHIERDRIQCLRPGRDLDGEVLNVLAELLMDEERATTNDRPHKWYLTTRMTSRAMGPGNKPAEFMRRHYSNSFFIGNLLECSKIFVPIHDVDHWLLFIFCVEDKVVEVWDSCLSEGASSGEKLVNDVMKNLDMLLQVAIKDSKLESFSFTNFTPITITNAPQQNNASDCGIFVANFMQERNLGDICENKYDSHNERARLLLRIVLGDVNSEAVKVKEEALKRFGKPMNKGKNKLPVKRKSVTVSSMRK